LKRRSAWFSIALLKRAAPRKRVPWPEWLEGATALGLSVGALGLHWACFRHAGALWRDEAGGVHLATLPTVGELWRWLTHDSFPLLFPLLVRGWSALGWGETDAALRALGLALGCLLLGSVWLTARWLGLRAPVLALGMLAVNLPVVRWGDSLRGYGCGAALVVLSLGLVWRQMQAPGPGRWLLAGLAILLSVQCLYANAFLVLAVCLAGAAVCWLRRQGAAARSVLALCIPGGLSLLPYARPIMDAQDHYVLQKVRVDAAALGETLLPALGQPELIRAWLWLGLAGSVLVATVRVAPKVRSCARPEGGALTLFAGLALAAGCFSFGVYLQLAQLVKVWHFLPLLALGALCVEAGWAHRNVRWRLVAQAAVVTVVVAGFPASLRSARVAMTGMDTVAGELAQRADQKDLIVVYPWYFGISFGRYFRGATPWLTVPDIEDRRFHRYDLVKAAILTSAPLRPVFERVESTLRAGARVWFVGEPPPAGLEEPAPDLVPPGPIPGLANGWWEAYHTHRWGRQAARFFNRHAAQLQAVPLVFRPPALELEAPALYVAWGWRDTHE